MKRLRTMFDGLRARLTAAVAAVVVLTVAIVFVVVYRDTGSRLRAEIDRSIQVDATQLAHAVTEQPGASALKVLATAKHYAASQPYGPSAALLFVLIPHVGTATNHPELFGSAQADDGEPPTEQLHENAEGARLASPYPGYRTAPAPDVGDLRMFQTRIMVDGRPAYAGAGEPLATVDSAQEEVARSFALAGAIALALAMIAAYVIGSRISAPLRRAASVAARIDAGDLGPRITVPPTAARELRVLAEAFNHMLDRLADAFAAQREFVADASHELRTPLTVMRGQLDLLAADPHADREDVLRVERMIQAEIARVSRLVDDLLVLAQAERRDFLHPADVELAGFVTELWDGLSLTAVRNFEVSVGAPVTIRADPDRLAQALRNLARNAIEHTTEPDGLVRIEVEQLNATMVRIAVTDDGPGIPPTEQERVFERFHRTDPARTRAAGGAGLGLSIVQAIVEAHGGSVRAVRADGGGARFEVDLPAPARRSNVRSASRARTAS